MKPDWYTANDWSKLPAGGNSLRQIFVRLEDWEVIAADRDRVGLGLDLARADRDKWFNRARELEAALREIARRESEAREIVTQNRWPSTLAIDLASQARLALETKAKELDCRHGIPRSLCSECPTSDRGEKR